MKKSYIKPEIELVEYVANDVIMNVSATLGDNDQTWLSAWSLDSQSILNDIQ